MLQYRRIVTGIGKGNIVKNDGLNMGYACLFPNSRFVCKNLLQYYIGPEKCKGCTLCSKKCPVGAITGTVKEPHVIDTTKCIKCGVCMDVCKFGAVVKK